MTQFLQDAEAIFAAARQAASGAGQEEQFHVLVTAGGGIRVVAGGEWTTAGIEAHYAPAAVYRVCRGPASVRVDGYSGARRCVLECGSPREVARRLLPDAACYRVEHFRLSLPA